VRPELGLKPIRESRQLFDPLSLDSHPLALYVGLLPTDGQQEPVRIPPTHPRKFKFHV
jgi:hypothetical protein